MRQRFELCEAKGFRILVKPFTMVGQCIQSVRRSIELYQRLKFTELGQLLTKRGEPGGLGEV